MFKKILSDVFEKFLYETKVQGNVKKAASSLGLGAVISYILIRMIKNKKLGLFNDGEINQQNLTKYIKCTKFYKNKINHLPEPTEEYLIERQKESDENLAAFYNEKLHHDNIVNKYKDTLVKKYRQLVYKDDFDVIHKEKFAKELENFIKNILYKNKELSKSDYNFEFIDILGLVENEVENCKDLEISDNPYDFEFQCAEILKKNGWDAEATQKSADQGIDVVAKKDGVLVALQCKLYSKPVGNKAVQEAYSGKQFYEANFAGVVSNNTYTVSARQLAKNCNILLLSPEDLPNLESLIK